MTVPPDVPHGMSVTCDAGHGCCGGAGRAQCVHRGACLVSLHGRLHVVDVLKHLRGAVVDERLRLGAHIRVRMKARARTGVSMWNPGPEMRSSSAPPR